MTEGRPGGRSVARARSGMSCPAMARTLPPPFGKCLHSPAGQRLHGGSVDARLWASGGVVRGKRGVTTNPDTSLTCPFRQICLANRLSCPDAKVNRIFKADRPKKLWGEPLCAIGSRSMARDFTCVLTSSGSIYLAFVIDVFARRIVALRVLHANPFRVTAWRLSTSMTTKFVRDALDQTIWQRKTPDNRSLVHHFDRGSQYLSIKCTERLAAAEIELLVGTVGDAYDNALAECVIACPKPRSSIRSARGNRCVKSSGKR